MSNTGSEEFVSNNTTLNGPHKVDQRNSGRLLAKDIKYTRKVSDFNLVSVLIPKEMWDLEAFCLSRLEEYWRKHSIAPETEAIPLAELIVKKFLDPDFVFPISDRKVNDLFRIRWTEKEDIPVAERYVNLKFRGSKLRSVCSQVVFAMGAQTGTPELQQYCDVVKALVQLAPSEDMLVRKVLEQERGPIKGLAQNCSIANINWIMSKLKMNVSLPLVHELFGSPTVLGKINAIWKLLEVHDVLWNGIEWSFVQSAVQHLYTSITWLMEQCAGFADILSDKFKWVKAKIMKNPDDVVTQAQNDLLDSIELSSTKMNYNDCLYEAIAPQLSMSPVQLKEQFLKYFRAMSPEKYAGILVMEGAEPSTEISYEEALEISDSDRMLGDIHTILMSYCFNVNIVVFKDNELVARDTFGMRDADYTVYLKHSYLHYSPADPKLVTVISNFHKEEALHQPSMCPCEDFSTTKCSFCDTKVCLSCWVTHCQDKILLTKPEDVFNLKEVDKKNPDSIAIGDEPVKERPVARVTPVTVVEPSPVISPPPVTVDTVPTFRDRLWDNWYRICDFFRNLNFSEIGRKIADFLKNLFGNVYSWLKTNPVMVSLMGVFASIASLLGFTLPSITNPADRRSLVSKLGDATRNLYYVQRTSGNLLETFKGFGDAMADVLGYNTDESIDLFKKRVLEASEKADKLLQLAEVNPGKFVNNRKEMQQFEQSIKEIDKIYHDLIKVSEKVNIQAINPIWMKLNKSTQSLKQIYTRWACNVSERQEPTVLWLYGETNLGKSRILNKVIQKLREHYGTDWEVFTLSKGTDHWNGFTGQEIIKFDDFAATRPGGENTDAMNLMNLKTSASFNPSMAALEEKNIMAKPKFIVVASNAPTIDLGSGIQDIAAFERRRDVFVKIQWPGHEGTCNKVANCQHIKDLADSLKNGGTENFDHLEMTILDPNVSVVTGRDQKLAFKERAITNIDDIVNRLVTLEETYRMKYERAIETIAKPQNASDVETSVFEEYPNIVLMGPPGTGKSFIMNAVATHYGDKAEVIKNDAQFDAFVLRGRADDDKSVVIIDDMSNHLDSKQLHAFLKLAKGRSEQISENTVPWIMGINKGPLMPHIYAAFNIPDDMFAKAEMEQVFFRRCVKYTTGWKQNFFQRLGVRIGAVKENLAERLKTKMVSENKPIEDFVIFKKEDKLVTQKTIIDNLCAAKSKVKKVQIEMTMPQEMPTTPDMYMKFLMSTEEFFEVMTRDSLMEIINLLKSNKVQINSGTLSKTNLFARIAKSVDSARNYTGVAFSDFESFFHQASLDGHLNNFTGYRAYLIFTDATYSISTTESGKARAARVIDCADGILEAKIELAGVAETIRTTDFLAFSISNFSPWFCFVGDLVMTLSKVGFSFLSVTKSISDQKNYYRSARMVKAVEEGAQDYIDTEMTSIAQRFGADVIVNDKRGNAAYSVNTPERGIFDDLRREDTPPNQKRNVKGVTRKSNQPIIKREDDSPGNRKRGDVSRKMKKEHLGSEHFQTAVTDKGVTTEYDDVTLRGTAMKSRAVVQAVMTLDEFDKLEEPPVYQAVIDQSILPIAESIVPNFLRIFNASNKFCCYGLVIKENIGTTVWHIQQTPQTYFAEDIDGNRYAMDFFKTVIDDDRIDFKLTPLDNSAQRNFKNIVKHIVSKNYVGYAGMQGILMNVTRSQTGKLPVVVMRIYSIVSHTSRYCQEVNHIVNLIEYKGYKMGTMITDVMTRDGDCGSVLLVSDPSAPEGRIIGIHSRASTTQAYVRPIYKEDYSALQMQTGEAKLHIGKYLGEAVPVEDEEYEGRLTKRIHLPETTKLFRNVAPIGEEKYEPSILSPEDTRNPGIDMIGQETDKWLQKPPELSQEDKNLYRKAVGLFAEHYANVLLRNNKKLSVLTKRQAINKYRLSIHSEPIPVQTSPGYPWNQMTKSQGKRDFISVDEDTGSRRFNQNTVTRKLFDAIDRLEQYCAGEGPAEEPIFQIALKDEPVKKKKIYDTPQTRTIACSPLHFTILMRQYTHSLVACMNDCQNEISCAVGIDPTSNDWDFMVRKALQMGKSAIAMDYKGWDFTVHPFEIECLAEFNISIMRKCCPDFTERDAMIIRRLYKILSHPLIIRHGKLFRALRGMMSGQPNTANENSDINEFRKYVCWYKIMMKYCPSLAGFDHFIANTERKFYGDDFFIVVAEHLKHLFNAETIREIEEPLFGVTLTSPDKESEIKPTVDIMKITFMSREFHLLGHKFVGRLEWPRVLKPTHWVHDFRKHKIWESPDAQVKNLEAAFQAVESALLAALPWGKSKYDTIRDPAQLQFSKLGYPKVLPDYDTLYIETFESPPSEEAVLGCSFDHIDLNEIKKVCGFVRPAVPSWAEDFGNRKSWHYGPEYTYTGTEHEARAPTHQVQKLIDFMNERYSRNWNSALFNWYPIRGRIPFHRDDEREIDQNEGVGCITIYGGGTLGFIAPNEPLYERLQNPGDIYIMEQENLVKFKHARYDHSCNTLSVTFRKIDSV